MSSVAAKEEFTFIILIGGPKGGSEVSRNLLIIF